MPKRLSDKTISNILSLLDSNLSLEQVRQRVGVCYKSVSEIARIHRSHRQRRPAGRPCKLSRNDCWQAVCLIRSGKAENAVDVTRELQEVVNGTISVQTVRRALKKEGMRAVMKKKKPKLLLRHKQQRLKFAQKYQHWMKNDWDNVIFSDETKINMFGSDGKQWGWKMVGEGLLDRLVSGTVKFGGRSIMVWGSISSRGAGILKIIKGRMTGGDYVEILEGPLQQSIEKLGSDKKHVIFQHDNDPKHTCKKAKNWLKTNKLRVLDWPAQSPDLNPIEHMWYLLKCKLAEYETEPKGILELQARVQET
jgi:transposase